jgi:guanosine-3',5'-bis(diphosphate) 3'-pyrophosphohydrolase
MTVPPPFLERLPLSQAAWAYADEAHRGQVRKLDGSPFIAHPVEVARLLHDAGAPDYVVAAGLLHDVVERTDVTLGDLLERFGPEVAGLVGAVTEDPHLTSYRERKARLRARATTAGDEAAILFAADKVSKVRQYRAQLAGAGDGAEPPRPRKMRHYTASLRQLEAVIPTHPLVQTLRAELAWVESPQGTSRTRSATAS